MFLLEILVLVLKKIVLFSNLWVFFSVKFVTFNRFLFISV